MSIETLAAPDGYMTLGEVVHSFIQKHGGNATNISRSLLSREIETAQGKVWSYTHQRPVSELEFAKLKEFYLSNFKELVADDMEVDSNSTSTSSSSSGTPMSPTPTSSASSLVNTPSTPSTPSTVPSTPTSSTPSSSTPSSPSLSSPSPNFSSPPSFIPPSTSSTSALSSSSDSKGTSSSSSGVHASSHSSTQPSSSSTSSSSSFPTQGETQSGSENELYKSKYLSSSSPTSSVSSSPSLSSTSSLNRPAPRTRTEPLPNNGYVSKIPCFIYQCAQESDRYLSHLKPNLTIRSCGMHSKLYSSKKGVADTCMMCSGGNNPEHLSIWTNGTVDYVLCNKCVAYQKEICHYHSDNVKVRDALAEMARKWKIFTEKPYRPPVGSEGTALTNSASSNSGSNAPSSNFSSKESNQNGATSVGLISPITSTNPLPLSISGTSSLSSSTSSPSSPRSNSNGNGNANSNNLENGNAGNNNLSTSGDMDMSDGAARLNRADRQAIRAGAHWMPSGPSCFCSSFYSRAHQLSQHFKLLWTLEKDKKITKTRKERLLKFLVEAEKKASIEACLLLISSPSAEKCGFELLSIIENIK